MQLGNQIDFCNCSLTSAGKGIIDGLGYFSFLNAVIPERFFQISCKEEKIPSLGISEVDSSLNLYVSRLSCNRYNKMEKIYELELKSGQNVVRHNVIIETADKIINKQGKSVMLDFFASCSDLCLLTVATSRRTMYISQSL